MMAKKNVRRWGRKALSLLLTLTMVTSMLQITVLATGEESAASSAQQIVTNGQEQSFADGKVKVSKMIESTDTENVFDITLNVVTTQSHETVIMTPPAAVSLVIDTSASMDAQVSGEEDGKTVTRSRLYWAKKAAEEFLEEFADPNGAARYVSLSEFYQYGYAKSSNGQYWFNVSDETEREKLSALINALVYTNHSGTNVEAGLMMAEDLLNDSSVKELAHKFLLVLSDGAPNAVSTANPSNGYVAGEYNGTYSSAEWDKDIYDREPLSSLFYDWAGYSGGGRYIYKAGNDIPDGSGKNEAKVDTMDDNGYYMGYYYDNNTKVQMTGFSNPYLYAAYRAHKVAQEISKNVPIYTINYGTAGEQIGANETDWNFSTGYSVDNWLKNHIASDPANAFGSGDSDNVAELFTRILGEIKEELSKYAQAWTVTDPMGERIEYISGSTNDGSLSVKNGTLTWTLADPTQQVEGNKTYYTYSATYRVKLDNVTPGSDSLATFVEGNAYATNGTTTLTYWLLVDENGNQYYVNESGAKINGDPTLTANFVVPSVKGYLADLTFTKVNEENAALAGAVFTLSGANGFEQEATSDAAGKVTFTNIPSGYTYTLAEKTAPDGYDKTESTYAVTVSYDTVSVAGVSDLANFTIANQKTYVPIPPKHTITATKIVTGKTASGEDVTLSAGQFSFQLLDDQGNVLQTKANAADGTVTFDEIDYANTGVGTYTYTVKEVIPASVPQHWTYDGTEYTVTVVVSQNAETGEYSKTVTVNGVENGPISFTNTYYEPQHALGSITVTKSTSGNTTPDNAQFQLEKKSGENNWVPVGNPVMYSVFVENAETGAKEYTFSNLPEGTYRVVETNADTVDGYSWEVSCNPAAGVELEKNTAANGDTTVSNGAITVTNTYTEHKGSLKITKTITGLTDAQKTDLAEKLVFTITGPNNYSTTVAYKAFNNGTYHLIDNLSVGAYEITENVADAQVEGYHLAYTYNNDSSAANAGAQVQNGKTAEATIANVYTKLPPTSVSGKFSINFGKVVSGDAYTLTGNDFTFNLTDSKNNAITGYNNANGKVTIEVPFNVDLVGETGNTTTRTFTYTLSEQVGSVEGMTYSKVQYPVSVVVTFNRTGNLAEWTWTVTDVTVTGAEDSISSDAEITLNLAGGAALFTNQYKMPTGTLTINKRAAGDNTRIPGEAAFIVKDESGKTVTTVYYKDFQNGSYTMNLPAGEYTVTEDYESAQVKGYKLKVDGGPTAKATVSVGENAYVGFTNNYELVPYTYTVVHEFYTNLNGTGYTRDGANVGVEYSAKTTPRMQEVFDAQSLTDVYTGNGATYERKAAYAESEISAVGTLRGGDRVYTIKYYRSDWNEGGLTIKKNISGLDPISENALEKVLSFTVKNSSGETVATVAYKDGGMTLPSLIPGTYTIEENNAAVLGYELNVTARDANADEDGYQIEVTAGSTPVTFNITNTYTSRVYNIWFDGGEHGSVEDGVNRSRWMEFDLDEDQDGKKDYNWSSRVLKLGDTIYELDDRDGANTKIYSGVTDYTVDTVLVAADNSEGMVLYTLTWKEYMEYIDTMKISKPSLTVDKGYKSDKEFYLNGGAVSFTGIEETLNRMNTYIDSSAQPVAADAESTVVPVHVDANGFYHIYYVAKYNEIGPGNLTINKSATGATVPASATFTIAGPDGYTNSVTYLDFVDGSYTFKNIPVGDYTVTETGAGVSGYSLTTSVDYGVDATVATVTEGETAVIAITNTYTRNGGGGGVRTPDPEVTIEEEEPPLANLPDEEPPLANLPDEEPPLAELPEEEVPLALAPMTGDTTALYALLALGSAMGLMVLFLTGKKREEEA